MQHMETRYTHSPLDIRHYSTEELRREFLAIDRDRTRSSNIDDA